jgi:hypothetical protein
MSQRPKVLPESPWSTGPQSQFAGRVKYRRLADPCLLANSGTEGTGDFRRTLGLWDLDLGPRD